MKKTITLILLAILTQLTTNCIAQRDYWKVFFPGYKAYEYKASIDNKSDLNVVLNNSTVGQPNEFLSLDKNGYLLYSHEVNEIALLHFKDSVGFRYEVSFLNHTLHVRKYDNQYNLLWHNLNTIAGSITSDFYMINSAQYLFTKNGKLIISGTIAIGSITAIFIDMNSGNTLNTYYDGSITEDPTNLYLQEDDSGNVNILFEAWNFELAFLQKISQTGVLLSNSVFGNIWTLTPETQFVKFTNNYIYVVSMDANLHFLKLDKTTFATVFNKTNSLIPNFSAIGNYFDANDSAYFLSYDAGFGAFERYDFNGNLVCADYSSNYFNLGYKFCNMGNSCFSSRDQLGEVDSCSFYACTKSYDTNTWWLINGTLLNGTTNAFKNEADGMLYFASKDAITNTIFGIIGFPYSKAKNFSGSLYFDVNNNCIKDSGDVVLPNQLIKIDPVGKFIFTNEAGYYENYLDSGAYTLTGVPFNNTLNFCPVSLTLNVIDTNNLYSGNDIAVQDQAGNLQDLSITINETASRPGFPVFVYLTINNNAPLLASGIVKLTMDSNTYTFNYASITPDSIVGDNYYWHVDNLDLLHNKSIFAQFTVKFFGVVLGTPYSNYAEVDNLVSETNLSNNIDVFQGTFVGSFDPNDKNVVPKGIGASGAISPLDSILKYKIQFQNTGTFQAYKIYVRDTIDSSLDISTFKLLSTSHDCAVSFIDTNVIQFTFEDIMLPASSTNEPLSHGFINYSIETKPNLAIYTQIKNKAAIYFDFNEPVITNETLNTIDAVGIDELKVSTLFSIYPNPVKEKLTIYTNSKSKNLTATIVDTQGRKLAEEQLIFNNGYATINTGGLQNGYYIIQLKDKDAVQFKPFIKMK